MEKTGGESENERFRSAADKYAAYLETPEGRLRLDLAFANMEECFPRASRPLQALDIGGGTGAMAVRLATLGMQVTFIDESEAMLELARRGAHEEGVMDSVCLMRGDALQLQDVLQGQKFDVIVCHNVLEFVDDPDGVLRAAAGALRDAESVLSVLVRSQPGEVLKAAIREGDLSIAEQNLNSEWAQESLYGGRVRLFTRDSLQKMMRDTSLAVISERGVRVISDYLPATISRSDEYQRIFQLEQTLGKRTEFAAVARYIQCVARRAGSEMKGGA